MKILLLLTCFVWSAPVATFGYKRINCTTLYGPCMFSAGIAKNVSIDCIGNGKNFKDCLLTAEQGPILTLNSPCFINQHGPLCYCSTRNVDLTPLYMYACLPDGVYGHLKTKKSTASVPNNADSSVTPDYVSDAMDTETTEAESLTENCMVTRNCSVADCMAWTNICCWIQTSDTTELSDPNWCIQELYQPLCCQSTKINLDSTIHEPAISPWTTSSPSAVSSATAATATVPGVPSQLRLIVGLAVGIPLGVLLLVSLVVIAVLIRRRRSRPNDPYQSLAKPTDANTYQTVQSAKTSDKLQGETYLYAPTSNYEEPEAVSINQSPVRHRDPDNRQATSGDPLATYGDTTLVDNTLYNMDGNPTTTVSRDPTYNDTTLVDNSLYNVESDLKMSTPVASDDYEMTVIENSMYGSHRAGN